MTVLVLLVVAIVFVSWWKWKRNKHQGTVDSDQLVPPNRYKLVLH